MVFSEREIPVLIVWSENLNLHLSDRTVKMKLKVKLKRKLELLLNASIELPTRLSKSPRSP